MRSVTVEPKLGVEPSTFSLPRKRSTDELQGQVTSAASGIRYPHRFALKGGWTTCRTAAVVGAERGAVRTFTRHPFLPVGGNPPHRRTGERRPACRAGYQVPPLAWERYRADDRGRTGDIDLGKVALCQLSYVRAVPGIYHMPCVERGFGVPRSHRSWLPIALSRLVRAHAPRFRAVDREPATQR